MFIYHFVDPDLRVEIIFKKERTAQNVYILEKYDGLLELVAFAQNWGILQTRIDQNPFRPHENEFSLFSNIKMNVTNRAEKGDEKTGSFV